LSDDELPWLGAAELGRRIRARETSAVQATRLYLDRIEWTCPLGVEGWDQNVMRL